MTIDFDALSKTWDGHINELIKISAKKTEMIEKKHRQIVKGAFQVFLEKGYHPASIREISDASGMSMGQLYHYVSSKDDVLFLIHRHLQISFLKHMHIIDSECENHDAVKVFLKSLRHAIKFLVENKKEFQFIYTESKYLSKKHLQVVLQMDDKNIVQYWRQLLEAVQNQTNIQMDISMTANIIAYLTVLIPMRGWNLKERSIKEQQELLVAYILRGIGIDEATLSN